MSSYRSVFSGIIITLFFIIILTRAHAQVAVELAAKARYDQYLHFHSLVRGTSVVPHWYPDGNRFWFAEGAPENIIIYQVNPVQNTKNELFDRERLRQALRQVLGHEPAGQGIPYSEFSFVGGEDSVKFAVDGKMFLLCLKNYNIVSIPAATPVITSSPSQILSFDGLRFVAEKDNNLWLGDPSNQKIQQLTADGANDYPWTIPPGAWSPDSRLLLVKRSDGRKVHHLPVIDYSTTTEKVDYSVYAKTGGAIEVPELFVLDTRSKKSVRIDVGKNSQQYIFPLGWRPDGLEVLFLRLSRLGKKLELLSADPNTGVSRVILAEEQKTFVAGLDFMLDGWKKQFTPIKNGREFIWLSERDGWKHLYLYNRYGKLIRRLTTGCYPVTGIVHTDEKAGWVYFSANAESDLYATNLYRVDLQGRNFKKLTTAAGLHNNFQFSASGKYFLDTYSSPSQPYSTELRSVDGRFLRRINTADISKLAAIGFRPPESFVVKAADGVTDLYGILYKPYNFDPNRKYPVIECVYAGPFMTVVSHGFLPSTGLALQAQALAQLGYITIMIDSRGTTERSKAFQDAIYGNIGRFEIPDRLAALKRLGEKRPYMDLTRVGIYGHSWGGYFALRALLMAPEVYRVGIASAPGELTEGAEVNEPYMGLPDGNKAGYVYGTNTKYADKLQGKLLFIHGTSDTNAPLSTTIRMINALIKAGRPYDLLLLPGRTHYLDGDKYVNDAIARYFEENLKTINE